MIRVGILGATGYTALELIKILLRHPEAKITALTSRQEGRPHVMSSSLRRSTERRLSMSRRGVAVVPVRAGPVRYARPSFCRRCARQVAVIRTNHASPGEMIVLRNCPIHRRHVSVSEARRGVRTRRADPASDRCW